MTEPAELYEDPLGASCDTTAELIPQLPRIMRNKSWLRAAALMERWLNNPANSNAEQGTPDIHTVSMSWIVSFERAARVFDQMVIDRIWMNEAGRGQIEQSLVTNGLLPSAQGASRTFGELPVNICPPTQCRAALHDKFHIQTRRVQQSVLTAPMDELTAALANFAFHIVAVGEVRFLGTEKTGSRYQVSIRRVGIYARDTYDFDDRGHRIAQPLGVWDCNPEYVGTNTLRGRYLNNESFRNWRDKHGKGRGGDYLVFSDIHWREVNDTFEFVR
jgi:hypothetical protein